MNRIPQAEICEEASDESPVIWDDDAIQAVIRAANRRGICPTVVFNEPETVRLYGSYAPAVRIA